MKLSQELLDEIELAVDMLVASCDPSTLDQRFVVRDGENAYFNKGLASKALTIELLYWSDMLERAESS